MRAALLFSLLIPAVAFGYRVEVIQHSGAPSQRIDLVILGDGYRAQDQAQLTADATRMTSSLFAMAPWASYKALFNVRVVHVVSNQNGGDLGADGQMRDTALGATFNCQGTDRLLCIDSERVADVLSTHTPDYDLALVVVNDPKYGGAGGSFPTSSTNEFAGDIVIHELGHSLGGLADEYEAPYPGYPSCGAECPEANATVNPPGSPRWAQWISSSTPVPTPESDPTYSTEVGLFEGGRYQTTGVFRPVLSQCRMNSLLAPYCPVCGEQLIKSFWNRVPTMFDAKSPEVSALGEVCGDVTFSLLPTPVVGANYTFAWYVDDVAQPSTTSSFTFTPTLDAGTIKVVVRDNTVDVRSDPNLLLQDSFSWTVTGGGLSCPVGLCDVSATCGVDGGCDRVRRDAGEVCGAAVCANGAKSWIGTCDVVGECAGFGGSLSCGAYGCDDAGSECRTTCERSADCATGHECSSGVCFFDAGVQILNDGGFGSPAPIKLWLATAEQPAAGCGCQASGAPSLILFAFAAAALLRRRTVSFRS